MVEELSIKIRPRGLNRLKRKLKKAPPEVLARVENQVKQSTVNVQREARRNSPVDTGRLRSSIRFKISNQGRTGQVFTDVEYASFVEFGTSNTPAQPYLIPAWESERPKFIKAVAKILQVSLK